MLEIWKFQIVKRYIPPAVAMRKYSCIDSHWKLPTMHGQPLWMTYSPSYGGMWNISGVSPQQQASESLFPRRTLINSYGHVVDDGTPHATALVEKGDDFLGASRSMLINRYGHVVEDGTPHATALVESGDVLFDSPSSEVVVYRSDAVLIPHKRDARVAYAGATASVFHLLASICVALCALLLLNAPVNTPLLL
ncbi:unnamed protein product [Closterium sp. NIES-64]|nr:unnamed protein product [Closterium sp. NIES-64]